MLLELSSDQDFLRETTARFLDDKVPPRELRRLRDDPGGFDAAYWRQGAELGWTSLLVDAGLGGGSVSEHGLVDLTLLAHEFGRRAAPGPFVPTNVVAGALSSANAHQELLSGLLDGTVIVTWCLGEAPPNDGFEEVAFEIRVDRSGLVLDGEKRPVESATEATHFLVTGRTGAGLTQVLVPADSTGVSVVPMKAVDLTRRFATVRFDDVRVPVESVVGQVAKADEDVERQLQHALVLANAESVGAMQTAFDMTVAWAFDRYSFGRPLASYQALKHRFAAMACWLEASHAISDEAAHAVATGSPQAGELVRAAAGYIGDRGPELLQDCVQLHGGIGLTYEHDLHLYLRRLTVNRSLWGSPAEHRRHLGRTIVETDTVA